LYRKNKIKRANAINIENEFDFPQKCLLKISRSWEIYEDYKRANGLSGCPEKRLGICCELKPNAKFQNPRTTPSGRKVTKEREIEWEREKKKRKMLLLV
jgi:hypothetical protein